MGVAMRKIAFIFPGQGAQYAGMGKDFYENIPVSKEVYEKASAVCGFDIAKLCFEDNEQLNITEYTQIAMLTTSISMLRALEEKGIVSQVNAGLSLGEYGALVASKVIKEEDAFSIVLKRGQLMQEAVPTGGAMAAIIGMSAVKIEQICGQSQGIVSIANYNCPGQIVITGEEKSVAHTCEKLKEAGAKRTLMLNVSGPFHSVMLKEAGKKLGESLETVKIQPITIPYVSNATGDYVTDFNQVKSLLERQVYSPVKWQQSVERLIVDGVDTFIEIGPGKTLSGFMRKTNKSVNMQNIGKVEDLDRVIEALTDS